MFLMIELRDLIPIYTDESQRGLELAIKGLDCEEPKGVIFDLIFSKFELNLKQMELVIAFYDVFSSMSLN